LPDEWTHLTVNLPHLGRDIRITLYPTRMVFELDGEPLDIEVEEERVRLERGTTKVEVSRPASPST
jgi:trehalose/maltose hydrolase-like predicted phosphorylase